MKDRLYLIFISIFCLVLALKSYGQDIHFSQFSSSPMNLNPALTGDFEGSYRFVGNGRRQWSSVTIPYQTFGVSADANSILRIKNVGAGISIYQDKTGDSHFSTLQLNVSGSYRIKLNRDSTHFITLGVQSGFTSRRIDYENLTYDNQFNGIVYDPNLPSTENFQNAGRVYPNLNTGINWRYKIKNRKTVSVGFSVFNVSAPKQSFFGNTLILLDRRYNLHVSGNYKLAKKVDLVPSALFSTQGTYKEFVLGSSVKYSLNTASAHYRAFYIGGWVRTKDAVFVSIGMDFQKLYVGLSYDINYSNLRPASNRRGGGEFSVIYILDVLPKKQHYKLCPAYI